MINNHHHGREYAYSFFSKLIYIQHRIIEWKNVRNMICERWRKTKKKNAGVGAAARAISWQWANFSASNRCSLFISSQTITHTDDIHENAMQFIGRHCLLHSTNTSFHRHFNWIELMLGIKKKHQEFCENKKSNCFWSIFAWNSFILYQTKLKNYL